MLNQFSVSILILLSLSATTTRAQSMDAIPGGVLDVPNLKLSMLESASLLPLPGASPSPAEDPWILNEWSMKQWRERKIEEELTGTVTGDFLKTEQSDPDALTVSVHTKTLSGVEHTRYLTLSRLLHSILIKKALIEKLGYDFPAASAVKVFTLSFKTLADRDSFKALLEKRTLAAAKRWVVAETELTLTLQDVVASEAPILTTPIPELVAPVAIADVTENINLFPWTIGQHEEKGYRIPDLNQARAPTEAELQRTLFRLAKLKRADWEEIVRIGAYPTPIEFLLIEKLISRSESILKEYSIPHVTIEFDPEPSRLPRLLNGQLEPREWEGYASEFSIDTRVTSPELGAITRFTRSKAFSLMLQVAVAEFNRLSFLHNDMQTAFNKHQAALLADMTTRYNQTGEVQKTPLKTWGFGFLSGQLILSRDLVIGSYLGTNNQLQLVDEIGVRLDLNGQLRLQGGPAYLDAEMGGDLAVSRTYSHVKPIRNLPKSESEYFSTAILPNIIAGGARNLTSEKLKVWLKVGESLIITDSLVANANLRASAILYGFVDLSTTFTGKELLLSRFHIFRKDDETFQVHQDLGEAHDFALALGLGLRIKPPAFLSFLRSKKNGDGKAYIPILNYRKTSHHGISETHFYPINLNEQSITWLKAAISSGSLEILDSHVKPIRIHNNFRESSVVGNAFLSSNRHLKSNMELTIEGQDGSKRSFIRDSFSKTSSRNLVKPDRQMLDFFASVASSTELLNSLTTRTVNPGYTLFGSARTQILEYEVEKNADGSSGDSFVKLSRVFNGYELDKNRLNSILSSFSTRSGKTITAPTSFSNSDQLRFYNLSLNTELSDASIQHLVSLNQNQIYRAKISSAGENAEDSEVQDASLEIYSLLQDFSRNKGSKQLMQALALADEYFSPSELIDLLGGESKIHVYAKLEGVGTRYNDPEQNTALQDRFEIAGAPILQGPLSAEEHQLGMTDGEFLSQWITQTVF